MNFAAEPLCKGQTLNVTKVLATWLLHEKEEARLVCAKSLASMKDAKTAVPALAQSLAGDPDFRVRVETAQTLGRIGPEAKDAMKALENAKSDPNEMVRDAARSALEKVKAE